MFTPLPSAPVCCHSEHCRAVGSHRFACHKKWARVGHNRVQGGFRRDFTSSQPDVRMPSHYDSVVGMTGGGILQDGVARGGAKLTRWSVPSVYEVGVGARHDMACMTGLCSGEGLVEAWRRLRRREGGS